MRRLLAVIVIVVMAAAAGAERSGPEARAERPLAITVEVGDRGQLEALAEVVAIEGYRHGVVETVAWPHQLAELERRGLRWRQAPVKTAAITMCPAGWVDDEARAWDCYPTYGQYVALLEKLAADHPERCRLEWLGASSNQLRPHDLWALVISDEVALEEDEPEVLLVSSMHGDETVGIVLLLRLAHELLAGYGSDPALTTLVDEVELWLNPVANPDGTYLGGDHTVAGAIRYFTDANGSPVWGLDPNRNYPDPVAGDHPDNRWWWPETEAMMAFAERQSITLSANLHGGAEVVNYPWDSTSRRHPDDDWLYDASREYADLAHDASPGSYLVDLDNGVTNGWDWYEVHGGRQDYMTYFHGGREVTLELSAVKLLDSGQLEAHWDWNRASLLAWVGRSLSGVRGVVTDPDGTPLAARVEVVGRDTEVDRSWVLTDPDVGDYHRLLLPGTYDLRVSAPGYHPEEVAGVAVSGGDAVRRDVVLAPMTHRDVSGRVVWGLGPVPAVGAAVEVPSLGLGPVLTDSEGRYTLPAVPFAALTFVVSAERAETVVEAREITYAEEAVDFTLFRPPLECCAGEQ